MAEKPNILLITTDTQRWDTLHCMGSAFAKSPNLDRLAAEGVLFENGHSSSPACMPTRCSLLTGVHAQVHGCIENGFERFEHLPTLPDLLAKAGYHNIMVGKTHFGPVPASFHVQRLVRGEKHGDNEDAYGEYIRAKGYPRVTADLEPNPVPEDIFMDAFLATATIQEIQHAVQSRDKPFFAFCSMLSPHGPIDPPGRWASLYDETEFPPVNYQEGEVAQHPAALRALLGYDAPSGAVWEKNRVRRRLYYGLAAYCDHQVGRLLRFLDEAGLRKDTLVIFTSDHGTQLLDHGFYNKHTWYDESWRVPLIMSQPGTLPQGEQRGFAIWNDLTTAILAAAGTGCDTMQGYDLYSPLRRREASPREYAVGVCFRSLAVATKRWKLEYYFEDGSGRLFDRLADPREQSNLYTYPAFAHIRCLLLEGLLAWYGDAADLSGLRARAHQGGPIAKRAVDHLNQVRGLDSEERLKTVCRQADRLS